LPSAEARALLRGRHAFSTPYGRGLWVSLWVDADIDWSRMAALVERSYRAVANGRMLATLERQTSNAEPRTRNLELRT
jgi:hypothetical protein